MTSMTLDIDVPCVHVFADGKPCRMADPKAHIHRLDNACVNNSYDRHHVYTPPTTVTLHIAGRIKRIRLDTPVVEAG